jgi:predicted component of type VI protein secretion system
VAKLIISRDAIVVQEVELGAVRTTIGRHPHNDIVIGHQAVSARHAAVTRSDGVIMLEDLDSSNGTFLNGQRIERAVLADGDCVAIANYSLTYSAQATVPPVPLIGSIEVLNGASAGKTLMLIKPLTTLGSPGVLVVVVTRQADGYFIAQVQGVADAQVNGERVGRTPQQLRHGDELELTGTRMRFSAKNG